MTKLGCFVLSGKLNLLLLITVIAFIISFWLGLAVIIIEVIELSLLMRLTVHKK